MIMNIVRAPHISKSKPAVKHCTSLAFQAVARGNPPCILVHVAIFVGIGNTSIQDQL